MFFLFLLTNKNEEGNPCKRLKKLSNPENTVQAFDHHATSNPFITETPLNDACLVKKFEYQDKILKKLRLGREGKCENPSALMAKIKEEGGI